MRVDHISAEPVRGKLRGVRVDAIPADPLARMPATVSLGFTIDSPGTVERRRWLSPLAARLLAGSLIAAADAAQEAPPDR